MGYKYDPSALRSAADGNKSAAMSIDKGLATDIPPIDAGASSEIVGQAVATLVSIGITLAQTFEEIGKRVDASDGGYADVENSNEGLMRYAARYLNNPVYDGPPGPLKDAPVRKTEAPYPTR